MAVNQGSQGRIPSCDYREFRPYLNQHPWGTLIADLVDAHWFFLLASTSESKDWQSLSRPVVGCIQVQGVCVAKESGLDQQKFGRADQAEAAFPLRKTNVDVTGSVRLSGASR